MEPEFKTYLPRRRVFARASLLYLALAAGLCAWGSVDGWDGAPITLLITACATLYLGFASVCLLALILGRPQLQVSSGQIRLRHVFRTVTVDRNDLGLFDVVPAGMLYLRRRPIAALARIKAGGVGRPWWQRSELVLPDVFRASAWTIIQDLNRSHPDPRTRRSFSPAMLAPAITPWATLGLVGFIVLVFAGQMIVSSRLAAEFRGPSSWVFWAFGGLHFRSVYHDGEWYRLLAGPFLHANVRHLVLNGIGLLLGGSMLERIIGHARLLTVFFLGILVSTQASLFFDTPVTVSVGASGGIVAIFTTLFFAASHIPAGPARRFVRRFSFLIVGLSFLPLDYIGAGLHMDIAAHLGGAFLGAAIAPLQLRPQPLLRGRGGRFRPANVIWSSVAIATVSSMGLAARAYPRHIALIENVMPQDQVPRADGEWAARGPDLLARYPKDPRSHYAFAKALARGGRFAAAEQELRTARIMLPETAILIGQEFDGSIALLLAFVLSKQGKRDAAVAEAQPLCTKAAARTRDQDAVRLLTDLRLCG